MKLNKMFTFLYKKDASFYPLYINQSAVVESAALLLVELMKADTYERRSELCKQIKMNESKGDLIANQIFEGLYKTRRTVFDREDMQLLASRIETFLDYIHDSAKKMVIYHPQTIDSVWIEIGESILEDAKILSGLIRELKNIKEKAKFLMQKCIRIKEIEHEVDDLYECYMSNLFEVEKNSIAVTKNKNIVQSLEDTTDKAKEIADCIKTIIVKEV